MSQPAIRVAVIGLGAVAQSVHLPLIRRRPELFSLVSITDISPSLVTSVGDAFGVPESGRFHSLDALLDGSEIDAVIVCSGGSHEHIVISALERGLAVLCEKPLAFALSEIATIRAALPDDGAPRLMVGYMKQYDPAVSRAVELLSTVDDIRTIDVTVLHPTGQTQLEFAHLLAGGKDVASETLDDIGATDRVLWTTAIGEVDEELWRVYSGCLLSSLSHDMSILRRLMGAVTSVDHVDIWRQRSAHQLHEAGRDVKALGSWPPSIRIAGKWQDSSRFMMDWHYLADYPSYRETVRIVHGAGSIELTFPSPYLLHAPTVLRQYSADGAAEARTEYHSIAEAFELQLEAFAEMVNNGTPPHTGIDGAEQDIRTSQAIVATYARRSGLEIGGEAGATMRS